MEDTSRTVYTVLENLGYTSDFRKFCVENADTYDMIETLASRYKYLLDPEDAQLVYRCAGSRVDGTYRQSLNSDMDMLIINRELTVGEIGDNGVFYHMIYMDKYPGYALLRANVSNKPSSEEGPFKTMTDSMGHAFLTNELELYLFQENLDRSGPAVKYAKSTFKLTENDFVYAYQCMTWPQIADEWFGREHRHSWPSNETIEEFRTMPCLLVPASHPHCTTNRHQHWRLSFSLQERHLMVNLTDVQYKCFVLLKMIKEDIITPKLGKSLTSYHCKTSLFYTIEENDQVIWRPENLLECVRKCLQQLLNWTERGFCPNYFLPSSNLFLGKVEDDKLDKLFLILKELVRRLANEICELGIENVAVWIQAVNNNDVQTKRRLMDEADRQFTNTFLKLLCSSAESLNILYESSLSIDNRAKRLNVLFNLLGQESYSDERESLNYVIGCMTADVASELMSKALQTNGQERDWYIGAAVNHFIRALALEDKISRLKLANVLIATGYRQSAGKILRETEKDIMMVCVYIGFEYSFRLQKNLDDIRIKELARDFIRCPVRELLKRFTCGPVMFGPVEMAVIPHALVFEMFRTVATPPGLKEWCAEHRRFCLYFVMIDAVNMFHLLKYHVGIYENFNEYLSCIIKSGVTISETVYNMVSWEARKAGFYGLSAQMCRKSWIEHCLQLKDLGIMLMIPDRLSECNAAKLHMAVLVYELWKDKVKMEQGKTQIEQIKGNKKQEHAGRK